MYTLVPHRAKHNPYRAVLRSLPVIKAGFLGLLTVGLLVLVTVSWSHFYLWSEPTSKVGGMDWLYISVMTFSAIIGVFGAVWGGIWMFEDMPDEWYRFKRWLQTKADELDSVND